MVLVFPWVAYNSKFENQIIMKTQTILKTFTVALITVTMIACDSQKKNENSVEIAKDQNDEVFTERDDEKDADFIVNTVASNYAEIKLAQLAQTKSADPQVKELASKLESDHKKILNELKAYATKNGITIPMEEAESDRKDIDDLAKEDAKDFDKKWCKMVENKHEKTIDKLESRLDKTEDTELKNWISSTLPGLRTHEEMLEQHEDRLK